MRQNGRQGVARFLLSTGEWFLGRAFASLLPASPAIHSIQPVPGLKTRLPGYCAAVSHGGK